MSTLKVNKIESTTSGGDCVVNATNKPGRNLIVNGAMQVAQRGTSSTDNGYQTVDRMRLSRGGVNENPTQSQHALTSSDTGPWAKGFRYSYHILNGNQTSLDTDDRIYVEYRIEAQDLANSGWDYTSASSYITLSFWAMSSVAQTFMGTLKTEDGTQQNYPFSFALSANTWTKVTKSIPGNSNIQIDNNNDKGAIISINPYRGTNYSDSGVSLNTWAAYAGGTQFPDMTSTWYSTDDSTFEFTGLQLEVGDTATDFEHRSYADELQRSKRYFNMFANPASETYSDDKGRQTLFSGMVWNKDTKDCRFSGSFDVAMRAAPSLYKVVGTSYFRIMVVGGANSTSDWTLLGSWSNCFDIKCTAVDSFGTNDNGMAIYALCFNSAARFGWNAEL